MTERMTAEWETDRRHALKHGGGRFYLIRLRNIPADTYLKKGGEYPFDVRGRRGVKRVLARVDSLTACREMVDGEVKITGYFGIARPVKREATDE